MEGAPQAAYFNNLADQWWVNDGAFGVLHSMNPARISFIKKLVNQFFPKNGLKNLNVLDVGCGGGIVCEPLARLGAKVTGIDASEQAILAARAHAHEYNLSIQYECKSLKDIKGSYDLVTCLEVIEHVDNLSDFIHELTKKIKVGGTLILSTLNRTVFSYVVGILGAEYIAKKVPVGTHDWQKFLEPFELISLVEKYGMKAVSLEGLNYSLLKREWYLGGQLRMNYIVGFQKKILD